MMTEELLRIALREYIDVKSEYDRLSRLLDELEEKSTSTKSLSDLSERVRGSLPEGAKFEDIVIDKADIEIMLSEEVAQIRQAKDNVMKLIALAGNRNQKFILRCRYIYGLRFERIPKVSSYSLDHVYTLHRQAIKEILAKLNSK